MEVAGRNNFQYVVIRKVPGDATTKTLCTFLISRTSSSSRDNASLSECRLTHAQTILGRIGRTTLFFWLRPSEFHAPRSQEVAEDCTCRLQKTETWCYWSPAKSLWKPSWTFRSAELRDQGRHSDTRNGTVSSCFLDLNETLWFPSLHFLWIDLFPSSSCIYPPQHQRSSTHRSAKLIKDGTGNSTPVAIILHIPTSCCGDVDVERRDVIIWLKELQ
jgi:hypothetical protein